jgi:hypothetical protein
MICRCTTESSTVELLIDYCFNSFFKKPCIADTARRIETYLEPDRLHTQTSSYIHTIEANGPNTYKTSDTHTS